VKGSRRGRVNDSDYDDEIAYKPVKRRRRGEVEEDEDEEEDLTYNSRSKKRRRLHSEDEKSEVDFNADELQAPQDYEILLEG